MNEYIENTSQLPYMVSDTVRKELTTRIETILYLTYERHIFDKNERSRKHLILPDTILGPSSEDEIPNSFNFL